MCIQVDDTNIIEKSLASKQFVYFMMMYIYINRYNVQLYMMKRD